jgi:hypothetical protein
VTDLRQPGTALRAARARRRSRAAAPVTLTPVTFCRWTLRTLRRELIDGYHLPGPRSFVSGTIRAGGLPALDKAPVFVCGAPRSGTSFLGSAIAASPSVSYHHEPAVTKVWARAAYTSERAKPSPETVFRITPRLLIALNGHSSRTYVDKTPQYCFIIPFLASVFPRAKFILIVRDGHDAAWSYAQKPWLRQMAAYDGRYEDGGYPVGPVARFWVEPARRAEWERTSDLHRVIWAWRRHTEAAIEGMESVPEDRTLRVRYEQLSEHTRIAGDLSAFLELDDAAAGSVADALGGFEAGSIGVGRSQLTEQELAIAREEAGPTLARLGYL